MYGVAVVSLIGVLFDGIVMWYEGLALVLGYIVYIVGEALFFHLCFVAQIALAPPHELIATTHFVRSTAMYCNDYISLKVRCMVSRVRRKSRVRPYREVTEIMPLLQDQQKAAAAANGHTNGGGAYATLDTIVEDNQMGKCGEREWKAKRYDYPRFDGVLMCVGPFRYVARRRRR